MSRPKHAPRPAGGKAGVTSGLSARERARAAEQAQQRRRERRILAIAAVTIVVLLVAGGVGFQAWRTGRAPSGVPGTGAPGTGAPSDAAVELQPGQPVELGSAGAPVQLTLYSDFHCPHCAEFEKTYGLVLRAAHERGAAALRIMPMAFIDEGSASAANAFGCAAQAGFGRAYFDGLFANHTLAWSDQQLIGLADQVAGSPSAEFRSCVTEASNGGWVDSVNAAADQAGVTSTPTLFLGDDRVDLTTVTPDGLQDMIDQVAGR